MKSEYFLSFVVLFQIVVVTLQLIIPLYGITTEETASTYRIIVTFVTYVPAILIIAKRNLSSLLIPFAVYSFVTLFHYVIFPYSSKFIESRQAITLTPIAILTAEIVYNIRNFNIFAKMLLWVSRFSLLLALLYVWGRQHLPVELAGTYSMSFGYSMLLPTAFLFVQKYWIDRILSFLLFLMILLVGSRGPFIVLVIFIIVDVLFMSNAKKKMKTTWSIIVIGALCIPLAYSFFDFESSRTLNLVSTNEAISHASGRDILYEKAQRAILDSPILGHGIGADRGIIGAYCHNIFLEVTLHYGIIFSSFLFALLGYVIFYLYFHPNLLEPYGGRRLLIMIFLYGFIPKLVSGSYLIDVNFAFMIGYLFKCMHASKSNLLICNKLYEDYIKNHK